MFYEHPQDYQIILPDKNDTKASQRAYKQIFHRSTLYPCVAIGSSQFNKFIEFMRSLYHNKMYQTGNHILP